MGAAPALNVIVTVVPPRAVVTPVVVGMPTVVVVLPMVVTHLLPANEEGASEDDSRLDPCLLETNKDFFLPRR